MPRAAVVRSYSSDDSVLASRTRRSTPRRTTRSASENPRAPHCSLPLYWPAPQMRLSTKAGMHRFSWDLHYDPVGERGPAGDVDATGRGAAADVSDERHAVGAGRGSTVYG